MESVQKYQHQLLERARFLFYEDPISPATEEAFLETPRHLFVKRYRVWGTAEWFEVNEHNLEQHLSMLYDDRALILFGHDDENVPSTISQPTFVLDMLDMLKLEPGHRVFELGAGSGWNAALIGHIVGPHGRVYSLEIIPEIARMAAESVAGLGIDNVTILEADGGDGYAAGAPYDRAIFAAGAYDLPGHFYDQLKNDGLLLIVIKNEGGGDNLFLLQKSGGHFESLESTPCGFVQMTGKYHLDSLEPLDLETVSEWAALKTQEISRSPFWWGGKGRGFRWRTMGIRSYLGITEPLFRSFKIPKTDEHPREEHYFGLWDQANQSLVLAKDDHLIAYGSPAAKERLIEDVRCWVDLGMPSAASFKLRVYPVGVPLPARDKQWIVRRRESQFVWSLEAL